MTKAIINIGLLAGISDPESPLRGAQLRQMSAIVHAYLIIEDGTIAEFGSMSDWEGGIQTDLVIDAQGRFVIPAWCDSHTHLVFAGSRETEFVDKLNGLSYAEIAAKGGGILNSANLLSDTSEDELFIQAWSRLMEVTKSGTASIEIKSGYGLSVDSELKMLRVIKRLKEKSNLNIRSSFLGAHTFPLEYRSDHQAYIRLLTERMLPMIQQEKLADFIDVFCEDGFFSAAETDQLCKAGLLYGLKPKIHVNQLNSIGGIQTAISNGAVSADHLEVMTNEDIHDLSRSNVIGTLLPTAAFFLRMPYQPARTMIDQGCAIALASDFNPGSSPSGNMNFVVSLSCIQMKMLPEEAINAATINGAFAMELASTTGSIAVGKRADLIMTKPIPSLSYLPYAFGSSQIDKVFIKGELI
jgi:imidazolonepropionase